VPPWAVALILYTCALALALASWPVVRRGPAARLLAWGAISAVVLATPVIARPWSADAHVIVRFVFVVMMSVIVLRLVDGHLAAEWWRSRTWADWARFLAHPNILVWRVHVGERPRGRVEGARIVAVSTLEIVAGSLLLAWAWDAGLAERSFWLDHVVKLVAIYLIALDGGLAAITGLSLLLGAPMLDNSRHPVAARTPADFWRRYNRSAGMFFVHDVFLPLGGRRRPALCAFLALLLNGVIHEYLFAVVSGRVTGYQVAFFAVQGLAVALTFRWRPRGAWVVVGVAGTLVFNAIASVLFFASGDTIVDWYPEGALFLR
jgi:hypothetical protein